MINSLAALFGRLGQITKRVGTCGNTGLIVGAIAGGLLSLMDLTGSAMMSMSLSNVEIIYVALMMTAFGWLVMVFIMRALIRARFSSFALPVFVNALLVCLLTTFISNQFGLFKYAFIIGILIGLLIGSLLCALYQKLVAKGQ